MRCSWVRSLRTACSLAAFAFGFAATARATEPVATWTDFNNPTSGSYTLNINSSCTVGSDGSVTIGSNGGLSLALSANDPIRKGKLVTIVVDVENISDTTDSRTILALDLSGNNINLTRNSELNGEIHQRWNDATGYGNIGRVATIGRAQLALAYSGSSGTDSWIEGNKKASSDKLKSGTGEIANIYIGSKNGASQVMTGLKIRKLTIYADKLTTAEQIYGANHPNQWLKFNGNYDNMGLVSFGSLGEAAGNWDAGSDGQAMKVVDGATHPYGGGWQYGTGAWSVTVAAKPIANASNKVVLWSTGRSDGNNSWIVLAADSANQKVVLASKTKAVICEAPVVGINETFRLYTVRCDGSGNYELIVGDDIEHKASGTWSDTVPDDKFQIGAVQAGCPAGYARTTGTLIDDLRVYTRALADDEVRALSHRFTLQYLAGISGQMLFSDLEWSPNKPAEGFDSTSQLVMENTSAAKLTIDEPLTARSVQFTNGSGNALTLVLGNDSCAVGAWDFSKALGGVTIDARGLDGEEIAKNAVVGVPYSHWLIRGAVAGTPAVACPTMPSGYTATAEVVPEHGVRLVVTAPAWARFGAISVNFYRANPIGEGVSGFYPVNRSLWNNLTIGGGASGVYDGATFTLSANASSWSQAGVGDPIYRDYIDDAQGGGVTKSVTISNIPYPKYRIIVYFNSDAGNADLPFYPMVVNGVSYAGLYANGTASSTVKGRSATWGKNGARATPAEGNNALMTDVMTDTSATLDFSSGTTGRSGGRATPAAVQIVKVGEIGTSYFLTMNADVSASAAQWTPPKTVPFTAIDALTITNTATRATFTADEDITAGNLSIVSGAGKLWVFKKNAGVATDFGMLDFSHAVEGVGFDGTEGFTACQTLLDYARTHDEKFTFFGSGSNGALLDYGMAYNNYVFCGHYVFKGGTHTFQNASENAGQRFGANATVENPTIWVRDNTTLYFKSRNPCGWNAYTNTAGIIRIGDGAKVVATNSAAGTWYWSQQFYFDPGATLEIATESDKFRLNGGCGADAPQIVMPASAGGTAEITSAAAANNLCIGDNGYSAAAFKVGAGSTLTISAAMKTLMAGKLFGKYGEGTLKLKGDLGAFAPTYKVAEGTLEFDNGRTNKVGNALVNDGTILVSSGTVVFMDFPDGTTPGEVETAGDGKWYYGYTVNVNMLGEFPIPPGRTANQIKLFERGGKEVPFKVDGDTLKFEFAWQGGNAWWDFEFEGNLNNDGMANPKELTWDGGSPITKENAYVTDASGRQAIKIPCRPYCDPTFPETFTVVMYGKMVTSNNTVQVGIGSLDKGTKYSLFLATGDVSKNEVKLCLAHTLTEGKPATVLCTMNVANAQTANHLYAFVLKVEGGNTVVDTYLDGKLLQPYTYAGQLTLGTGFQIGAIHGGVGDTGFLRPTGDDSGATLDVLLAYDMELSSAVMSKLSVAYPYDSGKGKATRTVGTDGTWRQSGAWTQWSQAGGATTQDAPNADTAVEVTMAGDAALEMNLGSQANYERFSVEGAGKLTLTQGAGAVAPIIVGYSAIKTDITVAYESFQFGGNVDIEDGKMLAFDFASLNLSNVFVSTTIKLTGLATLGAGARVEAENLTQVPGRTAELVREGATGQYQLVITVEDHPFVYTIDAGAAAGVWTWRGVEVSAETVAANPAVLIVKEGEGTYATSINRAFEVRAGTLKATGYAGAPTITVKGGAFDVNGKADAAYHVVLAGGKLLNNGGGIGTNRKQFSSIRQTAASRIGGTGEFGYILNGWGANTLDLGGAVLTKEDNNVFSLCNCTVTNGTLLVAGGTLNASSRAVTFASDASLEIGAEGTLAVGANNTLNIGSVTGSEGAQISNDGTISAFTLSGTAALATTNGTFGTITLAGATLDVGRRRGLTLANNGTVNVTLTEDEDTGSAHQIELFTSAQGASIGLGKVRNHAGDDITDQCTLVGGTLTVGQEARIGATKYYTLADALAVVRDGQTIVLLKDASLSGAVTNAFDIDIGGHVLSGNKTEVKGALRVVDTADEKGMFVLRDLLSVPEGSAGRLVLNAVAYGNGGSVSIQSGALVNEGETVLDEIDLAVGSAGALDLSAGTSLSCRGFKSSGKVVGTNATLVVYGTLDVSSSTEIGKLNLPDGATLRGTGLKVTAQLTLGNFLAVEANEAQAKERLATVPEKSEFSTVATLNGVEGYVIRRSGDALRVLKDAVVSANVVVDTVPGTNFEALEVQGKVNDWGGTGHAYGKTNVYVIATSEKTGVSVTQVVDYVAGPSGREGTFEASFDGIEGGDTYLVSAQVHIEHGETEAQSRNADVVAARSVDGWIDEDAETFDGRKPGTGLWVGTNGSACSTNDVIRFTIEHWGTSTDFQPTNDTLAVRSSLVKDIHYKNARFECPGFYLGEMEQTLLSDQFAAITIAVDEDNDTNCYFAVANGAGKWQLVPREVFAPSLGSEYEIVIRVDYAAGTVLYSVVSVGGSTTRLATVDLGSVREDLELTFSGSGDVSEIVGICQDAHLMQVGDEEFWTFDDARRAAGETNSIIPLWKSRFEVTGDSGRFRILDDKGLLELIWQKWHHWGIEDGTYRYISGNNWIEYADAGGVVPNNGGWLVTNEVGLAWLAEQATNQWFCGEVTLGNDLDLSSKNWTPIAQFSGGFDGLGFVIKGLNNTNVNDDVLLGEAGHYYGGPTNDWNRAAYGLFATTTNAEFRNVAFEGVAISNVSVSVAPLLGMSAGGGLVVSNVAVSSGLVQGEGGAVAGLVGTAEGWDGVTVVGNTLAADVEAIGASDGDPRWAAGVMTIGGTNDTVGPLVVVGNVVSGTVANVVWNNEDGGNVAQVLAGTTWGTKFGEVAITNNLAAGAVSAEIKNHNGWRLGFEEWVSEAFPIVNLAAAVTRMTDEGYRRFVEATSPKSVPVDPVHRTARMLAGTFQNGARNFAGEWMDTISAMEENGNLWITGELLTNDVWQTVTVDRSVGFDLRGNTIYTIYDDNTFRITDDSRLSISNGTIIVPEGGAAFACVGASSVVSNDIVIVSVPGDFYDRTVWVDGGFAFMGEFLSVMGSLPSGTTVELEDASGITVDPEANALVLGGKRLARFSEFRSLVPAGDAAYVVELNSNAVPEFDLAVSQVASSEGLVISLSGTRAGLYYAVQRKASLVEKEWSSPAASDWKYVSVDGTPVSFALSTEESAGFYRIVVTDRDPSAE